MGCYDLTEAGVPQPSEQNKAKVVLTTRREDVCDLMHAQRKFKVNCLAWREAWRLFLSKAGEDVLKLDPAILKLAERIADECSGLPLALITVGQAMRSRRTVEEWRYAATTLRNSAAEFTSMEKKVISLLRFSFDSLSDDTTKSCFLYCAQYPEDWYLDKVNLINSWLGEGLLDQSDSLYEAYDKGHHIIGTLKLACLLESGDNYVKMHDMIRDMALWVISDRGAKKGKFFVITQVPQSVDFESPMESFANDLDFMPSLKVLDLSFNKHLAELPPETFMNWSPCNILRC
ncbi:hypothetical protein GQ457_09G007250 [Hibiscus cannabinus]